MTVLARSESRRRRTTCGGCGELAHENLRLCAELDDREQALRAAYTRLVETGDAERRRLERNLHDGAQQRVIAVAIRLRVLALRIAPDPVLAAAQDELAASLRELRELARGLHPAMLATGGLGFALEDLATRATLPVTIVGDPGRRWSDAATETAAYYLVSESLANISKHARAQAATITVSSDDERLVVEVTDDGVGGANPAAGSGLAGLADRMQALGGTLRVSSPSGGGTTVRAEFPVP